MPGFAWNEGARDMHRDLNRVFYRRLLAIGLALCLAACQSVTPRTWELPPGVKTMPVNGYEMAYVEKGAGTPVVLVHGATVDYRYLAATMDLLAARHRVLALSLRHHYPQRWNGKGDYHLPLLASDVAEFIRKLNAGPVHLVGHSYGGTVAFLVARDAPELVRSLVSMEGMSSASNLAPAASPAEAAAEKEYFARREALFERGDVDGALREFVARIGGHWDNVPEALRQMLRDNAWTLYANGKAGPVEVPCAQLQRLPMPALLVQGEKTTPLYAKVTDNLALCLSRVERATIAGAAHAAPRSHPAEFSRVVLEFVARQ
jgi:esterase